MAVEPALAAGGVGVVLGDEQIAEAQLRRRPELRAVRGERGQRARVQRRADGGAEGGALPDAPPGAALDAAFEELLGTQSTAELRREVQFPDADARSPLLAVAAPLLLLLFDHPGWRRVPPAASRCWLPLVCCCCC